MLDPETLPLDGLRRFCRRNRIRSLALFGSALRSDFGAESDVDFLVEFEKGASPGLMRLAGMEEELASLLGRRVDLVTAGSLSPYFRAQVLSEARPLDVAA